MWPRMRRQTLEPPWRFSIKYSRFFKQRPTPPSCYCFFKWAIPGLFFIYFRSSHSTIITTNQREKCPSSIQFWDSNQGALVHEFPPITTWPEDSRPPFTCLSCPFWWQAVSGIWNGKDCMVTTTYTTTVASWLACSTLILILMALLKMTFPIKELSYINFSKPDYS